MGRRQPAESICSSYLSIREIRRRGRGEGNQEGHDKGQSKAVSTLVKKSLDFEKKKVYQPTIPQEGGGIQPENYPQANRANSGWERRRVQNFQESYLSGEI